MMTLGEFNSNQRWLRKWNAFMEFMEQNRRRPSKYDEEERVLWNWCKHNRRLMRGGLLAADRVEHMNKLIEVAKKYQRINQYSYVDTTLNHTVLRKPDVVEGEIE